MTSPKPTFYRKLEDKLRDRSGSPLAKESPSHKRSKGENYLDELTSPKDPTVEFVVVSPQNRSVRH